MTDFILTTRRERRLLKSLGFLRTFYKINENFGMGTEVWYRPDPVYGEIQFHERDRRFRWVDESCGCARTFFYCLNRRRMETAYEMVLRGMERVLGEGGLRPTEAERRYLKRRGYIMSRSAEGVQSWRHPEVDGLCVSFPGFWMFGCPHEDVRYSSLYELLLDQHLYTGGLDAR